MILLLEYKAWKSFANIKRRWFLLDHDRPLLYKSVLCKPTYKKWWPRTSRRKKSFFFKVERRNFSGEISWHTSTGIQFALVEGLSHELESVSDRFIMSILLGRCGTVNCHPVFKRINKKTIFPGGNLTRIMLTKGF